MTSLKIGRISETAVCRTKISSTATPLGRQRVYVQFLEPLTVVIYYTKIWLFLKSVRMSETNARRAKISSIRPSGVETEFTLKLLHISEREARRAKKTSQV